MTGVRLVITLPPCDYYVVLIDLSGAQTRMASMHASAREKLFDGISRAAYHQGKRAACLLR